MHDRRDRRHFLRGTSAALTAIALTPATVFAQEKEEPEDVSPVEDLMREHGLLNRLLLVYEACGRRLAAKSGFDPAVLNQAAGIIKGFIEDYHEKLEEEHLFPRFEKAGKLTDLVAVLRTQHAAGRKVTARILQVTAAKGARRRAAPLIRDINLFVHMYRPHEAREDTVLFPALHSIVSRNEYDALGEDFEKKEHELFGKDGFEGMVDKVADLEKKLGIYDLARFTPS
ncbi:MAG TPA: hemerythrin domain-containing protein [Terriglobales bacterium]|nr:hemerythrin domain-containing protein [Terriglobales bacterium]